MTSSLLEPECWAPREELEYVEGKRAMRWFYVGICTAFLSIIFFWHLYFWAIQSVHNLSGKISTTLFDIINNHYCKELAFLQTPS